MEILIARPKPLILSLCDLTGNWPKYYRDSGEYDVVSLDYQRGPHEDVLTYEPTRQPYGVLAAPPCTYFASSGARWFNDPVRRPPEGMEHAKAIVKACVRLGKAASKFWALENPIGTIARHVPEVGRVKLRFDPCDYAGLAPEPEKDRYTKRTCIYGEFGLLLPFHRLSPTHEKGSSPIHRAPPSKDRANFRSATPLGFARAFFLANP